MYIINQNIFLILLLPVLLFAFPQPQSNGGIKYVNTRGLIQIEVLCKDPITGEDLVDKSQCDNGIDEGVINQLCTSNDPRGKELEASECKTRLKDACDCSTFGSEYTCVPSDQCLDVQNDFPDPTKFNPFQPRPAFSNNMHPSWCKKPKEAKCPNTGDTCCKNRLKIIVDRDPIPPKCGDNGKDFQCIPLQECLSGEIVATDLNVINITRNKKPTGINVVTKKKVASKDESPFEITSIITETFGDEFQDLLDDAFDFGDVVGMFNDTEETVKIQVNNKVTTCDKDIEVCCKILPSQKFHPQPPHPGPPPPPPAAPSPVKPPRCGRRNEKGSLENRVSITAEFPSDRRASTNFGEWPFACFLYEPTNEEGKNGIGNFIGGATLLAPGVVITGAFKVENYEGKNISMLEVRCGEWDVRNENEIGRFQNRKISEVTIHPFYTGGPDIGKKSFSDTMNYDFALLHLQEDFCFNDHISHVCLPENPNIKTGQYEEKNCYAMGWGPKSRFWENSTEVQQILRDVQLPMLQNDECERLLQQGQGEFRLGSDFKLHKSFNCAGGEDIPDSLCEGDGGGPLVCPGKDDSSSSYVLAGSASWGLGCDKKIPGVYSDITQGLCFIQWDTNCKHRDKYDEYFKIQGCNNWLEDEIAKLQGNFDGISAREGKLKKAIELRDSCNGLSPRQPLPLSPRQPLPQGNCPQAAKIFQPKFSFSIGSQ